MHFKSYNYLHPRHWPTWLGIALMRFFTLLPWKIQQNLGNCLGLLIAYLFKNRRRVSQINIDLAFPKLSQTKRDTLLKQHFKFNGKSLIDMGACWWMNAEKYKSISTIHGREHLDAAQQMGNVILLSGHFTTGESVVRALTAYGYSVQAMYKPTKNPLFEDFMYAKRSTHATLINNHKLKLFTENLCNGQISFYLPDQSFNKYVIYAPFFGQQTNTLTTTSMIAKVSKAQVLPIFSIRREDDSGYDIHILPALTNFPSDNDYADACKVNATIEEMIHYAPAQYLWGHRRFKHLKNGNNPYTR